MKGSYWSKDEKDLMEKYFKTKMSEMVLYERMHAINPDRSLEAVFRMIREYKSKGYEKGKTKVQKSLRVGYLDIEATALNASFGFMLSWYIKAAGKNEYDFSVITKKEISEYEFDKRVVRELLEAMKKYDIIYAHYGGDRRFDIPFIRTRAIVHGYGDMLPENAEKFIMDTWVTARNKLKFHSNRLGSIADVLGIENVKKTPLSVNQWILASAGEPKALEYIAIHNKRDVQVLERVHEKLKCVERGPLKSM